MIYYLPLALFLSSIFLSIILFVLTPVIWGDHYNIVNYTPLSNLLNNDFSILHTFNNVNVLIPSLLYGNVSFIPYINFTILSLFLYLTYPSKHLLLYNKNSYIYIFLLSLVFLSPDIISRFFIASREFPIIIFLFLSGFYLNSSPRLSFLFILISSLFRPLFFPLFLLIFFLNRSFRYTFYYLFTVLFICLIFFEPISELFYFYLSKSVDYHGVNSGYYMSFLFNLIGGFSVILGAKSLILFFIYNYVFHLFILFLLFFNIKFLMNIFFVNAVLSLLLFPHPRYLHIFIYFFLGLWYGSLTIKYTQFLHKH